MANVRGPIPRIAGFLAHEVIDVKFVSLHVERGCREGQQDHETGSFGMLFGYSNMELRPEDLRNVENETFFCKYGVHKPMNY